MSVTTDPNLRSYGVNYGSLHDPSYQAPLDSSLNSAAFGPYSLNGLQNASNNSSQQLLSPSSDGYSQPRTGLQFDIQRRNGTQTTPTRGGTLSSPTHASPATTFGGQPWNMDANGPLLDSPQTQTFSAENQKQLLPPQSLQHTSEMSASKSATTTSEGGGHFPGMKAIPDPPNLAEWRDRLFNIQGAVTLTEDEFHTYFPHVDNVYSHRSTQKYKRKPFISHYWDCRLKGRPPGTPKSDDPGKKKRKRNARERDLCDVKIKITEYLPSGDETAEEPSPNGSGRASGRKSVTFVMENGGNVSQPYGMLTPTSAHLPPNISPDHPATKGARYFTIQRVNGAGGTDENDEVHLHKHTLEDSDRIKKNSVQRGLLKDEKAKKRQQILHSQTADSLSGNSSSSSSRFMRTTGVAHTTAKSHAAPQPSKLVFFCNAFCPFAQRVWIALEVKKIPYQLVEVVPPFDGTYSTPTRFSRQGGMVSPAHSENWLPAALLEVCPEGQVPCLRHNNWAVWESDVIMEYLEDLTIGQPLLPVGNPQLRAHCRLWKDHINRKILPPFYALLLTPPATKPDTRSPNAQLRQSAALNGAQDGIKESSLTEDHYMLIETLQRGITALVNASHRTGPFFLGEQISFVDVAFAPWIIRLSRVLERFRAFPLPETGTRWRAWVDAIEADDRVRATVSDEGSYHNVYGAVGEDGWDMRDKPLKGFLEREWAKRLVRSEGFGLGGDVWGRPAERGGMPILSEISSQIMS